MLLNGLQLRKDFERITGYVEQMDVHNGYLTVREALRYSAKLRQEPSVPLQEKLDYVERVLEVCVFTANRTKTFVPDYLLIDDGNDAIGRRINRRSGIRIRYFGRRKETINYRNGACSQTTYSLFGRYVYREQCRQLEC